MMQEFFKYHGAGNDFVVIDGRGGGFSPSRELVASMCRRHTGIGADGLMILENDPMGSDFLMRYFNSDGGESTMCGNGGRCIALFADHLGIGGKHKTFRGVDGLHAVDILWRDGEAAEVSLGMKDVSGVEHGEGYWLLDTGSPHYVVFTDDVDGVDVVAEGRRIRYSDRFVASGGVNVNFVEVAGVGHIRVRTYERGVEDETLACGTGATASAIAAALRTGGVPDRFRVDVRGGNLKVQFETSGNEYFTNIFLEGPARRVFRGVAEPDKF